MINKIISFIYAFVIILSLNSDLFIIRVRIPLGDIPFPYLFWILIFVYAGINFKLLKLPLNGSFVSRSVLFGIFTHMILLLIKLNNEACIGAVKFSSGVYKAYFNFFVILMFLFLTLVVTYKTLKFRLSDESISIFNMPLLGIWLYMLLSVINQKQYIGLVLYVFTMVFTGVLFANKNNFRVFKSSALKLKDFILKPKIFLVFVFIAALAIRTIYLLRTMTNPSYHLTGADGHNYERLARTYLESGVPSPESFPLNELWSFELWSWIGHLGSWQYLALFYKIFGYSYFTFCFAQGILGAISCIFVYFIAKYLFNEAIARIATILAVFNFSMIFSSIVIDNMGLNIFCTTSTFFLLCKYCISKSENNSHISLFAFMGLVMGLLVMTFYNNIIFFLIILIWLFLLDINIKKIGIKKSLVHSSLFVLFSLGVVGLSLALFGLNNLKSFIALLFSSSSDTKIFFSGYSLPTEYPEMVSLGLGSATEIILNSVPVVMRDGLPALGVIIKFFTKSICNLFFSQGYGGFDPIFLVRNSDYSSCLWFYAYILTAFGAIIALLKRKLYGYSIAVWLLYLYITYTAAIHILFFRAEYRYRSLMEPYLIIFGSFGLWILYQNAKGRRKHEDFVNNNGL